MAKNNQSHPLDSYLRGIVREELTRMFSGFNANEEAIITDESEEPSTLNSGGSRESSSLSRGTGRRRKAKRSKGRLLNPATDRRLKANRNLDV